MLDACMLVALLLRSEHAVTGQAFESWQKLVRVDVVLLGGFDIITRGSVFAQQSFPCLRVIDHELGPPVGAHQRATKV